MRMGGVCVADLAILVPAAGASSRMKGADKLLEDVDGQPCLRHMVRRALQASDTVLIMVPSLDHPRVAALEGLKATIVVVENWADGMSASLKAGISALHASVSAAMILPADMPEITGQDMATLAAVFHASGVKILQAAAADGTAGHPVIFHRSLFAEFATLEGDRGAAPLLKTHRKSYAAFALEGTRAVLDLDTPADWAHWRASR